VNEDAPNFSLFFSQLFRFMALPNYFTQQLSQTKMQNQEILELANLRIDGRQFHQIRQLKHKIGVMPSADGSAYFEHGLNKVLVIVNGPQEMRKRSDTNDEKVWFEFHYIVLIWVIFDFYSVVFIAKYCSRHLLAEKEKFENRYC
jgi:hypothetical protein